MAFPDNSHILPSCFFFPKSFRPDIRRQCITTFWAMRRIEHLPHLDPSGPLLRLPGMFRGLVGSNMIDLNIPCSSPTPSSLSRRACKGVSFHLGLPRLWIPTKAMTMASPSATLATTTTMKNLLTTTVHTVKRTYALNPLMTPAPSPEEDRRMI